MTTVLRIFAAALCTGPLFSAINAPAKLHVNLGPPPLDAYTQTNTSGYVPNCSPAVTIRQCYQTALQGYRAQGVTGIRFQFSFRGGAESTALTSSGAINPTWSNNIGLFFQDIKAAGIDDITVTPNFYGWENDGAEYRTVNNPCTGTNTILRFWPSAPFGADDVSPSDNIPPVPWGAGMNNSYNCSPANPIFLGWQNIHNAIGVVLQTAKNSGLTVVEFDVQNEVNLQWFTVYGRLIRDNKHGSTGNPDLLDVVRWYMSQNGFNPNKVTWSTALPRVTSAGFDCGSVYGDSARVYHTSALIAAIAGGVFGRALNWSVTNNLPCGGSAVDMVATGVYHTQPDIIDSHIYPCVIQASGNRDCDLTQNNKVKDEAKLTFNGIRALMDSFGPTGWRGHNPQIFGAGFVLGETHSNTNSGGLSCENAPLSAPADTVTGFNQSTLAGTTVATFRPWENTRDSCYPLVQTINPPYTP